MPSPSTTSFILFENRRFTRSMTKLAAQGCAAVIVRRPLAERMASVNLKAPLPVARKASAVKPPAAKSSRSLPLPYKAGFGFTLSGSPRTPEERERLQKERLAFFRRGHAYQGQKDLPTVKVCAASASCGDRYEHDSVGGQANLNRIVSSTGLLAPPANNYPGHVLSPGLFLLIPGGHELAPLKWDEWRPTCRREHNRMVDTPMLSVPSASSSDNLSPDAPKRYLPRGWYAARAAEISEARVGKKRRAKVRAAAKGGRLRL